MAGIDPIVAAMIFRGGKVTEGYLYGGQFYKDSAHTELITGVLDTLYYNKTSGSTGLYLYNGASYVGLGGGSVTTDKFLSGWNCTTGLPTSFPYSTPYTYETGMHYKVSAVATGSGTNYKPNGSTYDGTASSTAETATVMVGDFYFYDGITWILLVNTEHIRDVQVAGTSVVDANGDALIPLANDSTPGVVKDSSTNYYSIEDGEIEGITAPNIWQYSTNENGLVSVQTLLDAFHAGDDSGTTGGFMPNNHYVLGSKSATFSFELVDGEFNDTIMVDFDATGGFTPTCSSTIVGATIPACVSGKHYSFAFRWNGDAWEFDWRAY